MADRKPLPPEHDAFLKASAAAARRLGAPEGMHVVLLVSGHPVPVHGSVNGPRRRLIAPKAVRLERAREALERLERRQFRKW